MIQKSGAEESSNVAELELLVAAGGAAATVPVSLSSCLSMNVNTMKQMRPMRSRAVQNATGTTTVGSPPIHTERRGEREHGKDAEACNGHLAAHGQSHLLAFKPSWQWLC